VQGAFGEEVCGVDYFVEEALCVGRRVNGWRGIDIWWLHWLAGGDVLRSNKSGVGELGGTYDWGVAKVLCQELRVGS
jgi:hypothetical protein